MQSNSQENEEPMPKCCCCTVKVGLFIYLIIVIILLVISAVRGGGISAWISIGIAFLTLFAIYAQHILMIKIFAALNLLAMLLSDIFVIIFIVAVLQNPDAVPFTLPPDSQVTREDVIRIIVISAAVTAVIQTSITLILVYYLRSYWVYLEKRNGKVARVNV